jgi:hypothetical protein
MNAGVFADSQRALKDTLAAVAEIFLRRDHAGARLRLALVGTSLAIYWLFLGLTFDFPRVLPAPWVQSLVFPVNVVLDLTTSLFAPVILAHLIPVAAALWLGLRLGAHYLADLFELESPSIASRYLRAAVFGLGYDSLKIAQGDLAKLERNSPLFRIGGPGYLQVYLGFAAVLETAEGAPRVYGPEGRRFIEGFERLRDVVDLRDQVRHLDEVEAVTADGMTVRARDVQMVFRTFGGGQARNLQTPYPYAEEAIRRLVYGRAVNTEGADRWTDALSDLARVEIQAFIRGLSLDSFLALQPSGPPADAGTGASTDSDRFHIPRRKLTDRFHTTEARDRLRRKGLELDWVGVGTWEIREPSTDDGGLALGTTIIDAWRDRQRAQRLNMPDYLARQSERGYRERSLAEIRQLIGTWMEAGLDGPPRCWSTLRKTLERLEVMASELAEEADSDAPDVGPAIAYLKDLTDPRELGGLSR